MADEQGTSKLFGDGLPGTGGDFIDPNDTEGHVKLTDDESAGPIKSRSWGEDDGRSPIGLFVPCHRVIAGDGSLGGYGAAAWGGVEAALELKQSLLRFEGVDVPRHR